MATVTLTSACNTNLSQTLVYENNSIRLREPSFSSYLSSTSEDKFLRILAESTQKQSTTITTPQEPLYQISLGRKKTEDGELSIFGAEKYFSGETEEEKTRIIEKGGRKHHPKKDEVVNLHPMKPKVIPGTPSASSEVSWNSQSALLPVLLKYPSRNRQFKGNGKRFFATFGCKCSCSDKKSVDIDQNVDCGKVHGKEIIKVPNKMEQDPIGLVGIKQTRPESRFKEEIPYQKVDTVGLGLHREECFTFPISNYGVGNLTVGRQFEGGENARKSLEVFGSPILDKTAKSLNLKKRLTMLSWDATPWVEDAPATAGRVGMHDDIESDSSSDLFEIKSLSGNDHPFFMRQASDSMSSCMTPTTCYEPSEASIEWSVVTASAANFSISSDYDEQRPITSVTNPKSLTTTTPTAKTAIGKEVQRRRPSILGCRSLKAVNVAGEAYRMSEKAKSNPQGHHR